jgi:hypothetical protein
MGQYYKIVFKHNGGSVVVNDRKIEGDGYILAKLLEHSWLGCDIADAVAYEMYKNPMQLAWIGDYADNGDEVEVITNGDISYEEVWGNDDSKHVFPAYKNDFDYSGKWLVNHDKKLAMSFDKYIAESKTKYGTIAPFPLLTAIGNGRGGGDYRDEYPCYDEVGTWAWNSISIEDAKPDGYEEFSVVFKEQ